MAIGQRTVAQGCPPNLGFEQGTFEGWQCFTGKVNGFGNIIFDTQFSYGPAYNRHVIVPNTSPQQKDPYGGFPINCPNGSGYSIKLGNEKDGADAEVISYTIDVPDNNEDFLITYYYAVVLQNPGHVLQSQPRFMAAVEDLTPDINPGRYKSPLNCADQLYVAASGLPGFKSKDFPLQGSIEGATMRIEYKEWAPASVRLKGYGGHKIKLVFSTTDCAEGSHFGYAYLDLDESCVTSSIVTGATTCYSQDLNLSASSGYETYAWYDASDFNTVLGQQRSLKISPIPPNGTRYALVAKPYGDVSCLDTIFTTVNRLSEVLNLVTNPVTFCADGSADITQAFVTLGSSPNLKLEYFADVGAGTYLSDPKAITESGTYYIRATNSYGCIAIKPVLVGSSAPAFLVADPDPVTFPATVNLANTHQPVANGDITYWKDAETTIPVNNYRTIGESGTYYVRAASNRVANCFIIKPVNVVINPPPDISVAGINTFSPNGDGVNDYFGLSAEGIYKINFVRIFNRYGETVFQSTDEHFKWDGNVNGKPAPIGTYYWMFNCYDFYNKKDASRSGSVTIIR